MIICLYLCPERPRRGQRSLVPQQTRIGYKSQPGFVPRRQAADTLLTGISQGCLAVQYFFIFTVLTWCLH